MKPLFMWAGGKSKMMKHYVPFMNFGKVDTYSEPFFGGMKATVHRFPVTYTAGRRKRTEDGYEAKKAMEILAYN